MPPKSFPLEKIFGSRTRVKIITLFTTGISRPYYVREISRAVGERLNAVRRELEILQKVGMLETYASKRRKYFTANRDFVLFKELMSIMRKAGPNIEDSLFKQLDRVGDIRYAAASGFFTGVADSPTDLLIIGRVEEAKLEEFAKRVEQQIGREITYTPITENEYRYRRNFNDIFLRQIFARPYKVIINRLDQHLQPEAPAKQKSASLV
jgi:DNA-binding transcriptional ArsR family regulator